MVGDTTAPQMLRVRMPSDSSGSTAMPVNFEPRPIPAISPDVDLSSQLNQISVSSPAAVSLAAPYPSHAITEDSPQSSTTSHPNGLDSAQIGIDFVLAYDLSQAVPRLTILTLVVVLNDLVSTTPTTPSNPASHTAMPSPSKHPYSVTPRSEAAKGHGTFRLRSWNACLNSPVDLTWTVNSRRCKPGTGSCPTVDSPS